MARKNYDSSVVSPDKESGENVVKRHEFHESYTKFDPRDTSNFCEEMELPPTKHITCRNRYLATQDACDKTAMLAYNLVGHLFEEFAIAEGLNLDLSKRSYLNCDKQIEQAKETNEQSSSKKRIRGPAIVRVIEELVPSFLDRHLLHSSIMKMTWEMCQSGRNHCQKELSSSLMQLVYEESTDTSTSMNEENNSSKDEENGTFFKPTKKLKSHHWQLLIIEPKKQNVVFLCSMGLKPDKNIVFIVDSAIDGYNRLKGSRKQRKPTWNINLKCHRQSFSYECGYYVMIHMLSIVSTGIVNSWNQIFGDSTPFHGDGITNVQERSANFILESI